MIAYADRCTWKSRNHQVINNDVVSGDISKQEGIVGEEFFWGGFSRGQMG